MARPTSSAALRERAQATAVAATDETGQKKPTLYDLINAQRTEVARALPAGVGPDRLLRVVLTEVRRTPKLQECSAPSILGALMQAAQLGLEPGPLGLAYLVPFWNRKRGERECQLIIGYRGLIDLARRSAQVTDVAAYPVHEADRFDVTYGDDPRIVHVPELRTDPGPVWCYYAVGRYRDGGHNAAIMTRAQVEAHRDRFGNTDNGSPWLTDFDAMARKTVVRELAKWMPLSIEARDAIASDGGTFRFDAGAVEVVDRPEDVLDVESEEAAPEAPSEAEAPAAGEAAAGAEDRGES